MAGWRRGGVFVLVAAMLAGCSGNLASALGMGKRAPDEFAVVRRQPLIMPPNFDLRPPHADVEGAQAAAAERETRATLTGSPAPEAQPARAAGSELLTQRGAATSPGESALLSRAGNAAGSPGPRGVPADGSAAPSTTDRALLDRVTRSGPPEQGAVATEPAAAPSARLPSGAGDDADAVQRLQTPAEDLP